MRSVSSPTPTSQMGGVVGPQGNSGVGGGGGGGAGGMENSLPGTSRDQISTMMASTTATPSTPPPLPPGTTTATGGNNIHPPNNSAGGNAAAYPSTANNSTLTTNSASSANSGGNSNSRGGNTATSSNTGTAINREQVYTWIQELSSLETREHALIELSRKREVLPDLAPMLWHSFGTIAALLQEIVMIYPVINPPTLNVRAEK